MSKQTGFTLLEVLIALAIIAIALTAIIKSTSASVQNMTYLQQKMIAHWVGLNTMTAIQLGLETPPLVNKNVAMLGQELYLTADLNNSPDSYVAKITITVSSNPNGTSPLVNLEGFLPVERR